MDVVFFGEQHADNSLLSLSIPGPFYSLKMCGTRGGGGRGFLTLWYVGTYTHIMYNACAYVEASLRLYISTT